MDNWIPTPVLVPRKPRITVAELEKLDEYTVNIICLNKIHRITLRKRGHVTLHDHDHKREAQMMKLQKALGAETPKCMQVLAYWQDGWGSGGPSLHSWRRGGNRYNRNRVTIPFQVSTFRTLSAQEATRRRYRAPYKPALALDVGKRRYEWLMKTMEPELTRRSLKLISNDWNNYLSFNLNQTQWSDWRLSTHS